MSAFRFMYQLGFVLSFAMAFTHCGRAPESMHLAEYDDENTAELVNAVELYLKQMNHPKNAQVSVAKIDSILKTGKADPNAYIVTDKGKPIEGGKLRNQSSEPLVQAVISQEAKTAAGIDAKNVVVPLLIKAGANVGLTRMGTDYHGETARSRSIEDFVFTMNDLSADNLELIRNKANVDPTEALQLAVVKPHVWKYSAERSKFIENLVRQGAKPDAKVQNELNASPLEYVMMVQEEIELRGVKIPKSKDNAVKLRVARGDDHGYYVEVQPAEFAHLRKIFEGALKK